MHEFYTTGRWFIYISIRYTWGLDQSGGTKTQRNSFFIPAYTNRSYFSEEKNLITQSIFKLISVRSSSDKGIFSLVDIITKAKFSISLYDFKISLLG